MRSRVLLVGAEDAALLEQGVDQGRLAVVDVGDDGDVSDSGSSDLWGRALSIPRRGALWLTAPPRGRPACRRPRGSRGPPGRGRRGPGAPRAPLARRASRRRRAQGRPARRERSRPGGRGGPRGSGPRSSAPCASAATTASIVAGATSGLSTGWSEHGVGAERLGGVEPRPDRGQHALAPALVDERPSPSGGSPASAAHPLRLGPEHRDDGGDARPREEAAGAGEEGPVRRAGSRAFGPPIRRPSPAASTIATMRIAAHWTTDEPHGSGGSLTPSETRPV